MNNNWKWILIFVAVFLVALFIALPILGRLVMGSGLRYGGFPMMSNNFGWNTPGGSHMSGFGMFGGGLWMLGRFLFPLILVGLVVLGVMALLRKPGTTEAASTNSIPCPHCGKHIQDNWVACPYCGDKTQ